MVTPVRQLVALGLVIALPLALGCRVEQTEEGELPDVDVQVEGGNAPEFDVDVADVDVGTETDTLVVERPTVDVDMPGEESDGGDAQR